MHRNPSHTAMMRSANFFSLSLAELRHGTEAIVPNTVTRRARPRWSIPTFVESCSMIPNTAAQTTIYATPVPTSAAPSFAEQVNVSHRTAPRLGWNQGLHALPMVARASFRLPMPPLQHTNTYSHGQKSQELKTTSALFAYDRGNGRWFPVTFDPFGDNESENGSFESNTGATAPSSPSLKTELSREEWETRVEANMKGDMKRDTNTNMKADAPKPAPLGERGSGGFGMGSLSEAELEAMCPKSRCWCGCEDEWDRTPFSLECSPDNAC